MQSALILDDQNENNGCTIVVPGSHLYDEYATQESLANAIPIISSAGDLVIWDSRLWHGAIENNSKKDRWSLISTFTRWWIKQNYQITNELPKDIYDDLSTEEKTIMGFCCSPPRNEYERIDIKAGYEILKSLGIRSRGINIISCPSCARQAFPVIETVKILEKRLAHIKKPINLSIIGCVVNGPGEAAQTEIGLTGGGQDSNLLYLSGVPYTKVPNSKIIDRIVQLVENKLKEKN